MLPKKAYGTEQSNGQKLQSKQCHLLSMQAPEGEGAPQPTDPTKFSGKKSKATAKKGAGSTQWDILKLSGIPEAEIPSFRYQPTPLLHMPGHLLAKLQLKSGVCAMVQKERVIEHTDSFSSSPT